MMSDNEEGLARELCRVDMRLDLDCILSADTLVKDAAVTE